MINLAENLLPHNEAIDDSKAPTIDASNDNTNTNNPQASTKAIESDNVHEEVLITIPGVIVNHVQNQQSVKIASGDLTIVRVKHSSDDAADVVVRVGADVHWALAKDEATVKLGDSHYFFSLPVPTSGSESENSELNYGLTISGSKGKDESLNQLDGILEQYSSFSVKKVSAGTSNEAKVKSPSSEGLPSYWATSPPNVEHYNGYLAKGIAVGSGQMIKGILWFGEKTIDGLEWTDEILTKTMEQGLRSLKLCSEGLKMLKRLLMIAKLSQNMGSGMFSVGLKLSGFFASSVLNSKVSQKFVNALPVEVVLASLEGYTKVSDAFEAVGKNVLTTSTAVTSKVLSKGYGEKAVEAGLGAASQAVGELQKALNPSNSIKPATLAKAAARAAESLNPLDSIKPTTLVSSGVKAVETLNPLSSVEPTTLVKSTTEVAEAVLNPLNSLKSTTLEKSATETAEILNPLNSVKTNYFMKSATAGVKSLIGK